MGEHGSEGGPALGRRPPLSKAAQGYEKPPITPRSDSLTGGPGPDGVWVTIGYLEPRAARQPLATSEARALFQAVYVAPRTLSFK